jgi:hypothetical protein
VPSRRITLVVLSLALAACGGGPSQRSAAPARTVEQFVREYQRVGFFAGQEPHSVARRITDAYRREWGEEPPLATRPDELALLAYDTDRVWFQDIERDVLEGNDEYVATFREWSRISRGAFGPTRVRERWKDEAGPPAIEFTLHGRRHRIDAADQGDFLDLCVLTTGINPLIARSGRQFAIYRPEPELGQVAFVVAITADERRALERRGWTFAAPAEVRRVFAYGRVAETGEPSPCA